MNRHESRILPRRTIPLRRLFLPTLLAVFILPISLMAADGPAQNSEAQTNWPRFRGWNGSGVSTQTNAPASWKSTNDTAEVWRAKIPAPGHGSPIVWNDRIFISGGTTAKREVFCFDAATGRLVWWRAIENVPDSPASADVSEDTTYAAATMATDGQRLYVVFGNGDSAALTLDGAIIWSRSFGPFKNMYGFATSPVIWKNTLLLQLDQGDTEPANSKLVALQSDTGKTLWKSSRAVTASWATPLIIDAAGKEQLITLANPFVISYSPADGGEIWRAQLLDGEIVPSPVFAGGMILIVNPGPSRLLALRPDGAGDITKTHVAWNKADNVPAIACPVSNGKLVFIVNSVGVVMCFNIINGKKIWEKNLDIEVQSSPGIIAGRLLILGSNGAVVMMEAGAEPRELRRFQLPDKFSASPAFAGGRIFVRGATNLYGLDLLSPSGQLGRK